MEDVAGVVDRLDPGQPFVFGRSVGSPHPVILELRAGIDIGADTAGVWQEGASNGMIIARDSGPLSPDACRVSTVMTSSCNSSR